VLDDPRSNRVKGIVRLNQKDARYETGLFLLEGAQGLKELVSSPKLIEEVLVTIDGAERQAELIDSLSKKRVTITQVSDQVMAQIAGTRTPQGIVSVVQHLDVELEDLMSTKPKLIAVIDQARDPGNLGAIIRAADAAGADGIILSADSVDLYNPKVTRSTAGSIFNIPIVIDADLVEAISMLKKIGLQVLSSSSNGSPITDLHPTELAQPTAWIFGNEAHGVRTEVASIADKTVALPIFGAAESLNLATAASVCLYFTAVAQRSNH